MLLNASAIWLSLAVSCCCLATTAMDIDPSVPHATTLAMVRQLLANTTTRGLLELVGVDNAALQLGSGTSALEVKASDIIIKGSTRSGLAGLLVIDCQGASTAVDVTGTNVTFVGIHFRNCVTSAIRYSNPTATAALSLVDCKLSSNGAGGTNDEGGALHVEIATQLLLKNCTFEQNVAWRGGAVFLPAKVINVTIMDCSFVGNSAADGGAVVMGKGINSTIVNSTFEGNKALSSASGPEVGMVSGVAPTICSAATKNCVGGAVSCMGCNMATVLNVTFSGNEAYMGGALYLDDGASIQQASNCRFWQNQGDIGGVMFANSANISSLGNITVERNSVANLSSPASSSNWEMWHSLLTLNATCLSSLEHAIICNNTGTVMLLLRPKCQFSLNQSTVSYNLKRGGSPGISPGLLTFHVEPNFSHPLVFYNSTFHDNGDTGVLLFVGIEDTTRKNDDRAVPILIYFCTFTNNIGIEPYAGAVHFEAGYRTYNSELFLDDSKIKNDPHAALLVFGSRFVNNSARQTAGNGNGGAILMRGGRGHTLSGCVFINNTADNTGGAVAYMYSTSVTEQAKSAKRNFLRLSGLGLDHDNSTYFPLEGFHSQNGTIVTEQWWNDHFEHNFWEQDKDAPNRTENKIMFLPWPFQYEQFSAAEPSIFIGNVAEFGGAVGIQLMRPSADSVVFQTIFESSIFTGNHAYLGGAIYIFNGHTMIQNCSFDGNSGRIGSGIFIDKMSRSWIQGCTIANSSFIVPAKDDEDLVGALQARRCTWATAAYAVLPYRSAGALAVVETSVLALQHCTFIGNSGADVGAAVYMAGVAAARRTIDLIRNLTFHHNVARLSGGAVWAERFKASLQMSEFAFYNNSATSDAGAMMMKSLAPQNWVALTNSTFHNNSAGRDGGGLAITNSELTFVVLSELMFEHNNAGHAGGGMYLNGTDTCLVLNSTYRGNRALAGGGLAAQAAPHLRLQNTTFEQNTGLYSMVPQTATTGGTVGMSCSKGEAVQAGGGMYLLQVADEVAVIQGGSFQNNTARHGGGLFINTAGACSHDCGVTVVKGTAFNANAAPNGGGPAIYTQHNDSLGLACTRSEEFAVNWKDLTNTTTQVMYMSNVSYAISQERNSDLASPTPFSCSSWSANLGGYGKDVTTTYYAVDGGTTEVGSGESLASNEPFKLQVALRDAFDQQIQSSGPFCEVQVPIELSSVPLSALAGQRVAFFQGGVSVFKDLTMRSPPGPVNLTIAVKDVPTKVVVVQIRSCTFGEVTVADTCQRCSSADEYSFNPTNGTCDRPCPSGANCTVVPRGRSNGTLMLPQNGYWHSSPFYPYMHRCRERFACLHDWKAQEKLSSYTANLSEPKLLPRDLDAYKQDQCSQGYAGLLCSACSPGYGRGSFGRCVECYNSGRDVVLYILLVLLNVVTIAAVIACQISSLNVVRRWRKMTVWAEDAPPPATAATAAAAADKTLACSHGGVVVHADAHHDKGAVCNGTTAGKDIGILIEHREIDIAPKLGLPDASSYAACQLEMCVLLHRMNMAGKIFISYLQVISLIRQVPLAWPWSSYAFLTIISQFVHDLGKVVSLECALSSSHSKAVRQTVIQALYPGLLAALAIPSWIIIYGLHKLRNRSLITAPVFIPKCWEYLRPRLTITFVTIVFMLYPSVTTTVLSTFSCATLDSKDTVRAYYQHATATRRYWTGDYSLICFKDDHLVLAAVLGSPGLAFFCCGVPVVIYFFLCFRKSEMLRIDFAALYGAVYQDYRAVHYYWEAVIMLRKLLVVVSIVFLNASGSSLQLTAVLGVLLIASALQLSTRPFKKDMAAHGNFLEEMGLQVAIATTFICLVLSTDALGGEDSRGRLAFGGVLVGINAVMIALFLYYIVKDLFAYLHLAKAMRKSRIKNNQIARSEQGNSDARTDTTDQKISRI